MAKTQLLTILLVVTCFLGGIVSVTDKEFEVLSKRIDDQMLMIQQLKQADIELRKENDRLNSIIGQLIIKEQGRKMDDENGFIPKSELLLQNSTIEERVALLELQVLAIQEDVGNLDEDVGNLDENVDFLFDEQIIQDERLVTLEQGTDAINAQVEDLEDTTLALDFRVTILEETGGGDGNSSVAELEVRVETLEVIAADHESRITAAETNVTDIEEAVGNQDTRLTAAEESIQGLQMTDVELDARIEDLEENSGDGSQNDTIAFSAALTSSSTIPLGSAVEFNIVLINEGDGYESSTGTFTVPADGDGFYYFSTYLPTDYDLDAYFDIQINGQTICTALGDRDHSVYADLADISCSGLAYAAEGDTVGVVYRSGDDSTPLYVNFNYYLNGFTGFRI